MTAPLPSAVRRIARLAVPAVALILVGAAPAVLRTRPLPPSMARMETDTARGARPDSILGFTGASADRERALEALLAQRVNRDSTDAAFRFLTAEPHPAGSARNKLLADWVAEKYRAAGLEDVKLHRYDVYLPWPREVSVTMTAPTVYKATMKEDPVDVDPDTKQDAGITYLGMSASGDVTGELVYASSGNPSDYDWLAAHGVSVKDKIVLVRYSVPYSYRGYKALVAQQRGAKALLIYSDPQEDGYRKGLVFPEGPYGPESHLQRGSITYDFIVPGDPLTPGWASVEGAKRIPIAEARSAPTIMMAPISARDAKPLLEALKGPVAPPSWQGALPFTYRVGAGPATVRVKIDMDGATRPIWVVEGRIKGTEEPDKYVVLGNHRDAWVFGGVDPSSGTASQLELARVLGGLAREGKRPRRTIVFADWDAEEWHLTGSTEWGEEFGADLRKNGIAYINVDGSTSGSDFESGNVASLNRLVVETARDATDPATGGSLLTAWGKSLAVAHDAVIGGGGSRSGPPLKPMDYPDNELGSGSDYTVFLNFLGLPVIGMDYDGPYGVYHSIYDDYYWMAHVGDPGFRYMTSMADVWGRMALRLANADVYPFDFRTYATRVGGFVDALAKQPGAEHVKLDAVRGAQRRWLAASERLETAQHAALAAPISAARTRALAAMNEALRQVEQQFLLADGIPGRPWFKHALYAPKATYAAMSLPGVQEAVDDKDWARANAQARALAERLNAAAAMVERAVQAAPR
ncbi:MAG: M28 family metallopeptidase [Proteobacteria bacterium]|nr:M28 family metallopeptidase [Pseudomonadota bacterium]